MKILKCSNIYKENKMEFTSSTCDWDDCIDCDCDCPDEIDPDCQDDGPIGCGNDCLGY